MALFCLFLALLFTANATIASGNYAYFGKANNVRYCMKKDGSSLKCTFYCCPATGKVTFINNEIKIGSDHCVSGSNLNDGSTLNVATITSSCTKFLVMTNGKLRLDSSHHDQLCIANFQIEQELRLKRCRDISDDYAFLTNGSCPATKADSSVVKSFVLADIQNPSQFLSHHNEEFLQLTNTKESFKLYSNGEIWLENDDFSKCVAPTVFRPNERLDLKADCRGYEYRYRDDIGTYELLYSGQCISRDGRLSACPTATTKIFEETATFHNNGAGKSSIFKQDSQTSRRSFGMTTSTAQLATSSKYEVTSSSTCELTSSSTNKLTSLPTSKLTSSATMVSKSSAVIKFTSSSMLRMNSLPSSKLTSSTILTKTPAITSTRKTTLSSTQGVPSSVYSLTSSTRPNSSSRTLLNVPQISKSLNSLPHPATPSPSRRSSTEPIAKSSPSKRSSAEPKVKSVSTTSPAFQDYFGPWNPWSSCSELCGGGIQSRERNCEGEFCLGSMSERRKCNERLCPIDGGFSSWTTWSHCSVKCGGGERTKERFCNNPSPMHGGLDCFGKKRIFEICGSNFCPIHGGWTQWTAWSACDKPCNTGMFRRWRYCTNPSPLFGGNPCAGNATEAIPCNTKVCPGEKIKLRNIRFDMEWNKNMITKGSEEYNAFANSLTLNARRIFEYSEANSSYVFCSINELRRGSINADFSFHFSALDSSQALLLQDSLHVEKYLGKLKILESDILLNVTSVPGSPPLNLTLTALSKTSIKAEWKEVPKHLQNGNVTGYILFYREKMLISAPYKSLATMDLNATVFGLSVFSDYAFRVLAYNENGNGLASESKSVFTNESVPSQPPRALNAVSTSGFEISIDWENFARQEGNNIILNAIVKFNDTKKRIGSISVAYPQSYATLRNLSPITTYIIDVCHATASGEGPCERTQCTTLSSAPSKAPSIVSVDSKIGHKILKVQWLPIPMQYVHGDLTAYKVIYKMIKVGGTPTFSLPVTKLVHPSLDFITLSDLQPNAEYRIQVLAVNEYGDGVSSPEYFGETCSCPPKIYTNYAASKPYIYTDNNGKMKGLFAEMLQNLTSYACGDCKNKTSVLDFVTNGKSGWAEKKSLTAMKKDIDDYVHLSFPIFGSTVLETYNGYAFVSVFPHPGVVYYIIQDTMAKQVHAVAVNLLNTWPIFLINLLLIVLSGFVVWALDSRGNSEFPRSFVPGVLNGMYWAYITMGTHGYGDKTPRNMAARLFAVIWMLVGMVNLAIFTGALTTAITSTQVYDSQKIYGAEVAAVNDTVAFRAGIYRNAKINTREVYTSIEQVAAALKRRDVRGALVDVYSAATRNDLFKHNDIVAKKLLKYQSAFGFVLAGDMKNAAPKFRDYLSVHAKGTLETMKKRIENFEIEAQTAKTVSLFEGDSPFFHYSVTTITVLLVLAGTFGILLQFWRKSKEKRVVKTEQCQTLDELEKATEECILLLSEAVETKIGRLLDSHTRIRLKFIESDPNSRNLELNENKTRGNNVLMSHTHSSAETCEGNSRGVEPKPSLITVSPINDQITEIDNQEP